ncbi:ADP-ribosyl transferase [Pantoea phage Phynn]|nr:ADP-ribosyl transferase [Pantoea phage Phynn]
MKTIHCREDHVVYYHGSCSVAGIENMLLPPVDSETLSEKGRKKNLDRVFLTRDIGLARIYAGRAARSIGGEPVLYRVVSPVDLVCMNDTAGATVYHAKWAFCEEV